MTEPVTTTACANCGHTEAAHEPECYVVSVVRGRARECLCVRYVAPEPAPADPVGAIRAVCEREMDPRVAVFDRQQGLARVILDLLDREQAIHADTLRRDLTAAHEEATELRKEMGALYKDRDALVTALYRRTVERDTAEATGYARGIADAAKAAHEALDWTCAESTCCGIAALAAIRALTPDSGATGGAT